MMLLGFAGLARTMRWRFASTQSSPSGLQDGILVPSPSRWGRQGRDGSERARSAMHRHPRPSGAAHWARGPVLYSKWQVLEVEDC